MQPTGQERMGKFNLFASLVVVALFAIIGICVINGVHSSRESGRRVACQKRMQDVLMGLSNYIEAKNEYPGYSNVLTMRDGSLFRNQRTGERTGVSWAISTMFYLEPSLRTVRMAVYTCPSDPHLEEEDGALSYVANCGMKDWSGSTTMPRDWPENGVFFDHYSGDPRVGENKAGQIPQVIMSNALISRGDGLQCTLLLTENIDAGKYRDNEETRIGVLWNPQGTIDASKTPPHLSPADETMRINGRRSLSHDPANSALLARPSSYHSGGVNVAFCDGRVQFVSDQIDYYVYCQLMSTNGQRVREPGSQDVIPGFDVKFNEAWISE